VPALPYLLVDDVMARKAKSRRVQEANPDDIARLVTEFEELAEGFLGAAFRIRHVTGEEVRLRGGVGMLAHYRPTAVTLVTVPTSVAVVSVPVTATVHVSGKITGASWSEVTALADYDHGFDEPPETVLRACALYVEASLNRDESGIPKDASSYSTQNSESYRISSPDWSAGRPTGFIAVDLLLNSTTSYRGY
jgi:hypothetical protein